MKKILSIMLAMVMMFSLVACANNGGNTDGNTGNNGGSVVTPDIGDKGNNAGNTGDADTEGSEDAGETGTEGSEDAGETGETGEEVDPDMGVDSLANQIVAKIAEANPETFGANMPIEGEMLEAYYPGLTNITVNDMAAYMPMMSAVVCEIVIVEVANSADIDAVKEIFQSRITYQVGDENNPGGAWYPESIEGWKNHSEIVTNGNYVMLIAWEGKDSAVEIFNNTVNG